MVSQIFPSVLTSIRGCQLYAKNDAIWYLAPSTAGRQSRRCISRCQMTGPGALRLLLLLFCVSTLFPFASQSILKGQALSFRPAAEGLPLILGTYFMLNVGRIFKAVEVLLSSSFSHCIIHWSKSATELKFWIPVIFVSGRPCPSWGGTQEEKFTPLTLMR